MATCTLLICRTSRSQVALIFHAFILLLTPLCPSTFLPCLLLVSCRPLHAPLLSVPVTNGTHTFVGENLPANTSTFADHQIARPVTTLEVELNTIRNHSNSRRGSRRNKRRYHSATCATGNSIDDCWRCDPHWQANRKRLADCAIGFGRDAIGGKYGKFYTVTDSGDDDPVTPRPGTLRHAVIQSEPLWIIFAADMTIRLKEELIMNSYKTIDGRGHNVHVAGGPCITIQYVSNVIIHGIHVHDCVPAGNALVRSSPSHYGWRTISDGDGISLFGADNVWIDHCSLSRCTDGLIDAIMGSTAITISNNYFTNHDKVLHGACSGDCTYMHVKFEACLLQKLLNVGRHNSYHSINGQKLSMFGSENRVKAGVISVRVFPSSHVSPDHIHVWCINLHWEMYAIGGSAAPTINSKGNRYTAPTNRFAKDVTMRIATSERQWELWDWRSEGDMFVNGAFFTPSGAGISTNYEKAASIGPKPSSSVSVLTASAGALSCKAGSAC